MAQDLDQRVAQWAFHRARHMNRWVLGLGGQVNWLPILDHLRACPSTRLEPGPAQTGMCDDATCEMQVVPIRASCDHWVNVRVQCEWYGSLSNLVQEFEEDTQ